MSRNLGMIDNDSGAEQNPQGCLGAVLRLFGIRFGGAESIPSVDQLPYRLKRQFLCAAELSFFKVAQQALPDGYCIVAKPQFADLLFVPRGTDRKTAFDNRIRTKHVDFVVCDFQTMTPRLVVELDDRTHERADRKHRDDFIDDAMAAADLASLHQPVRSAYVLSEIREKLFRNLSYDNRDHQLASQSGGLPNCPYCRVLLVTRTASKGALCGRQFLACQNFPDCRYVLNSHP